MQPLLSVIVPFYNVERYVRRCLASLSAQTYANLEIIVVDDGSLDGSRGIVEGVCAEDSRFTLVTQENQGLGPARNTGVAHATGDFLAVVDSDDIVPVHAYELMMDSLLASGSDLAAGDARRFTSLWVRDSYTHRVPFAEGATATHVRERPELALDRMAWNKVYRRSLWEQVGLSFPAMLYEDYPVTIRAQVEAHKVDVLKDPVYYWREREGGEPSITQSLWRLENLADRVRSAEMVVEYLRSAAPELLERVRAHFAVVDLRTVVAALHSAPEEDLDTVFALSRRMLGVVQPFPYEDLPPFDRVQARLLEAGDLPRLRRLLTYEDQHGTNAPVVTRGLLRKRTYQDLPFRGDRAAGVPASAYLVGAPAAVVATAIHDMKWSEGALVIEGVARVPEVILDERSSLEVWLESPQGNRVAATVVRSDGPTPDGVQPIHFVARFNPFLVKAAQRRLKTWAARVRIRQGDLDVTSPLASGLRTRAAYLPPEPLGDRVWAQPQIEAGEVGVALRSVRHFVTHATAVPEGILLRIKVDVADLGDGAPILELTRHSRVTHELVGEYRDQPAGADGTREALFRVDVGALGLGEVTFDPMEEPVAWVVRIRAGSRRRTLPTSPQFVGAARTIGSTQLRATRSPKGNFTLQQGPAAVAVDAAEWEGDDLLLAGDLQDTLDRPGKVSVELRRVRGVEAVERVDVPVVVAEGRFTTRIPMAHLAEVDRRVGVGLGETSHQAVATSWHVLLRSGDDVSKLHVVREQTAGLPGPRPLGGLEAVLTIGRGDTLALTFLPTAVVAPPVGERDTVEALGVTA
ncbi:glycosyltransferase [Mumia sp. zg.B21]|uniref:glycosyltransferase family 2 protein n=1 Tax=Mumia sp. zg.B21 TaxID=2855447 RepID=UPI001C6EAEFC|nr:glycosyltransferase family 2 protein [Mumia sp. zg.B21]MBW9209514.1 glycosyltransferase [Mumia sp. zg.B21]